MTQHIVIGAGPAGLTAAWELSRLGQQVLVLEADPRYVGGIARTVEYNGNRFDMGGHRFYSKSDEINRLWREMLPEGWVEVGRLSRIYYDQRFFPYPLAILPTLRGLGLVRSLSIAASFLVARCLPRRPEESFEDWIVNRFGYQLYRTFFKTYSEKVWGISCRDMNKDWAAQRIRGLSLAKAVQNALFPPRENSQVKTLIKRFAYPRFGPGQLWESVRDSVVLAGNRVELDKTVVCLRHHEGRVTAAETQDGSVYEGSQFVSTMTLRELIGALDPPPPAEVLRAASSLSYRDFLTVALIVNAAELFPDNWIYIHDPGVRVGRVQNYKNWSRDMVADPAQTCLGMEYFCNRGDGLWERSDAALIDLAAGEAARIGVARRADCIDGCVVRITNAYPVYDTDYREHRETIKNWLNRTFTNLYPAGRGGLHNYNSQDHSMMAAILSVRQMHFADVCDVWSINTDVEYAEEGAARKELDERLVPRPLSSQPRAARRGETSQSVVRSSSR